MGEQESQEIQNLTMQRAILEQQSKGIRRMEDAAIRECGRYTMLCHAERDKLADQIDDLNQKIKDAKID